MKTIYHPASGGEEIRYQHLDYKGTLRSQSDSNGLPIGGQNLYYPYGEVMVMGASATHRQYFQTGESDHTGFVHMGVRYYDPSIGRFLSPDPIDASVSAYTFASGNPIMFFDPSGLQSAQPDAGRPAFSLPSNPREPLHQKMHIRCTTTLLLNS
ncbi:RHS repeat-associated core domain-containing protein [bacterium AH-315-J21]|nr:RHS repeat-associated core domain-containing protein [bacterium AH-315-J21]